jgi:hypothetical protein
MMITIVHKIRLKPGIDHERFERWVREVDYAACPDLPSALGFAVHRASVEPIAEFHYFEVIQISSLEAFERDMATPLFQSLVTAFDQMAEVVEEISGTRLEPGYCR